MTNYKTIILLILAIGFYSCNSKVKSNNSEKNIQNEKIIPTEKLSEIKKEIKFSDTININFNENKTLLNILKILPETTMESWEWSKKDREKTVDYIEKNNFIIDTTEMYNNIKYIKPNTIGIQVVDGFWTLSIYDFGKKNYFIVTNDIVGDGNDIQTFNFSNNELKPLKMVNWFGEFEYDLLLNSDSTKCLELLKENENTYEYDFSDKNIITISSWLISKKESETCLKGNSIKYKLNKENRTFDIIDTYWKDNKNE
ncbi:hypothetical protein [Tenacibaculum finnmarkense]|uniref:hypothetical protein n=1 Tax=Tenacibaculum finnmarkense TaxID=2781243 RepID=UPI001EFAEEAF|nr:hypothetical protein [Tenacibaculum finnmarkense]MCG8749286.1 hypothetical protein [Tenacibaculum finnmarkense]